MRGTILRKILFFAFLVIAVTLAIVDFQLTRHETRRQTEAARARLTIELEILAPELAGIPRAEIKHWASTAAQRARARVTLIDQAGAVLVDSQHDAGTMENHASRPEVREALAGRPGTAVRRSATLGRDLLYVAVPLKKGASASGVLRLAVPLEDLDAAASAVRRRIWETSVISAGLALLVAFLISTSFSRRIVRLKEYAESLFDPSAPRAAEPAPDDELGDLSRSLTRLGTQMHEYIDRLQLEGSRRDAILGGMVEGVMAVDRSMRVTFCNDAFARAVALTGPVSEKQPLLRLVRQPDLIDILAGVLQSGAPAKGRLHFPALEGRSFEVYAAPLETASGSEVERGAIVILHDISELERLERVRKDFVSNVSHELRTPLAAIRGYSETLLNGGLEDAANNRKFLEIIQAHAVRLGNIASDLLALSQLESNNRPLERAVRVPVREACEIALRTVEPEARMRGVDLITGEIAPVEVSGSKIRLEQALVNLIENAVKFNRPGGHVWVETGRTEEGKARISVADNGIGIPSEDLPRIFERFYRVDKGRSRDTGGTGLGLSIVKHIVEQMRGSVQVTSELGQGSTFTIVLPAWEEEA